MTGLVYNNSNSNLRIIKTEVKPSGESVQLVRPIANGQKSTEQIVGELVNRFDYKTKEVKATDNELTAVQQAFGPNLAQELIKTYEGSNLVSDSQQDLIGERYLTEQIKQIEEQQKRSSILEKWSHLLYEGEKDYRSSSENNNANSVNNDNTNNNGMSNNEPESINNTNNSNNNYNTNNNSFGSNTNTLNSINYENTLRSGSTSQYNTLTIQSGQTKQFVHEESSRLRLAQVGALGQSSSPQTTSTSYQQESQVKLSQQGSYGQEVGYYEQQSQAQYPQYQAQYQAEVQSQFQPQYEQQYQQQYQSQYPAQFQPPYQSQFHTTSQVQAQSVPVSQAQYQSQFQPDMHPSLSQSPPASQLSAQHEKVDPAHQAQLQAQAAYKAQLEAQLAAEEKIRAETERQIRLQAEKIAKMHAEQEAKEQARFEARYQAHLMAQQQHIKPNRGNTSQNAEQPEHYLPKLENMNINQINLDAYNSPQFQAMLEQLSKPMSIQPEEVNFPPEWPTQDKINLLAEPIYIPAPQPIVIPAPNLINLQESSNIDSNKLKSLGLPEDTVKPTVTYYPSIATDQKYYNNFGIRQLNMNANLKRTGSNVSIPHYNYEENSHY